MTLEKVCVLIEETKLLIKEADDANQPKWAEAYRVRLKTLRRIQMRRLFEESPAKVPS